MNTWQKNCYKSWQRLRLKLDWNFIYWYSLFILISLIFAYANLNSVSISGYFLLWLCFFGVIGTTEEGDRLYG